MFPQFWSTQPGLTCWRKKALNCTVLCLARPGTEFACSGSVWGADYEEIKATESSEVCVGDAGEPCAWRWCQGTAFKWRLQSDGRTPSAAQRKGTFKIRALLYPDYFCTDINLSQIIRSWNNLKTKLKFNQSQTVLRSIQLVKRRKMRSLWEQQKNVCLKLIFWNFS